MAQLMIVLGDVEDAVRISEGAIRRAESLGDFGSLAFALGLSLFVLAMCGRIEATLRRAEAFEANASEKGARLWVSIAREWASWARGLISGDAAAAATEFRDIMAEDANGKNGNRRIWGMAFSPNSKARRVRSTTRSRRSQRVSRSPSKRAATARIRSSTGSGRHPRRARPRRRRSRLPRSPPHRAEPGRAHVRAPGRACAREALSIDRPPRRGPRRPRARARRFRADAGNAGDRRGAGAVGGYRGRHACEARINTAMAFVLF